MRFALTALIFVIGMFDLMLATSFLLQPLEAGQGLGVAPINSIGVSTIRGDFTAIFGVAGVTMMWGAWRRNADLMLVPMLLFGVTFAGRAVDLAVSGFYAGWAWPMTVEGSEVIVLLLGWHFLPHHKIEELTN